jgi:hypothetical protein
MTTDEVAWHHARLVAHDHGARLRLYDWILSNAAVCEAAERFQVAMSFGCICWPTLYAEALDVGVHHRIDTALPMVRLATTRH